MGAARREARREAINAGSKAGEGAKGWTCFRRGPQTQGNAGEGEMKDGDVLDIEIVARRNDWHDGIEIYMRQLSIGGGMAIALPVVMEKYETTKVARPMIEIGIHQAQQLMDSLWACGIRPAEGSGSAGSLAATERHLRDMQMIVIGLLKKGGVAIDPMQERAK